VTSPGHGFSNGDFVILRGIGGMIQLEGRTFKVNNATTDTFSLQTAAGIDVNTSSHGTYSPSAYMPGYSGLIYATYLANRAATFVYGLDYSGWLARAFGLYRIYIPGLGVSDEFRIDDAVWYQVARNAAAGEYHQRHGIILDGRFGYRRGVTFKDGVNGTKIYWSRLPAVFSSEWARTSNKVPSAHGANPATWMTEKRATGWFGGTMDAGDWDESLDFHVPAYYWLLDLGYEKLPVSARNINFGLPKSTELLDPVLYAGTDVLPDSVHQAIWYLDAYRRLQREDGATGSGLGFAGGGAGNAYEASPISRAQAFIYAPDPVANYLYALGAAKLATVLKAEGFTSLAAVWTASAEAAWNWAEAIYQSGLGDGGLRDAYFIGELDAKAKAGWSDAQYRTTMAQLQSLMTVRRIAAVGALFRLTERNAYRAIIEKYISAGPTHSGYTGIGLWEYVYSPAANSKLKNAVLNAAGGFQQLQTISVTPYMTGKIGYKNHSTINNTYIANSWPFVATLQAYIGTGALNLLGMMQDGQAVTLGANQTGFSYTNGLGYRNLSRTTLHLDARYLGLTEAPNGITHYGWDQPGIQFRFFNFSTDAPVNFTAETPTGKFEADYGTKKIYHPYRLSIPFAEHTVQNPFIVYHMEYTFHQTIIPQQIIAMWLHAWDGNTSMEFTDRQFETKQPLRR
jgi:endoglucanase